MLCKGGVRHQYGVHFKNGEDTFDYLRVDYVASPPVAVAAMTEKNMCPDWALY